MKMLTKLFAIAAFAVPALSFSGAASAQEAPDALVKRISSEVLDTAKNDKDIQSGDNTRIMQLVEQVLVFSKLLKKFQNLQVQKFGQLV